MVLTPGVAASLTKYLGGDVPPGPYPLPSYAPFDSANLKYWFAGDHDVFSDLSGLVPANNNDTVALWGNLGSEEDAQQSTGSNRPVFKEGGLNGLPYLECAGSEWFEALTGLTQPSGITNHTAATYFVVTDAVDSAGDRSILAGAGLTRGGKSGFKLYQNGEVDSFLSSKQNHIHAIADQLGARALSVPNIIGTGGVSQSTFSHKINNLDPSIAHSHGTNQSPTTAISNTDFLRGTGSQSGPFVGRIYEFIAWHGTSLSGQNYEIVHAYLNDKYKIFDYKPLTIRGTAAITGNDTSINVPLDGASQVGDFCIIFGVYGVLSGITTPAGWTNITGDTNANWTDKAFWKVLDSTDISNGYVTVAMGGSANVLAFASVTFVGADVTIYNAVRNYQSSNQSSVNLTNTGPSRAGDIVLAFGANRTTSNVTVTGGTMLEQENAGASIGLYTLSPPPGVVLPQHTYNYSSTIDRNSQIQLIIRGTQV